MRIDTRTLGVQARCLALDMRRHDDHRGAIERRMSRQQLERDQAETVDVALPSDRFTGGLLGTHVSRCAEIRPGDGKLRRSRFLLPSQHRTDAKVEDDRPVGLPLDDDVRRLHVAMDDAMRVSRLERRRDFADEALRPRVRESRAIPDHFGQRLPIDELHHVVWSATLWQLADEIDARDVRMHEGGACLRLTNESRVRHRITGKVRRQYLDGHEALEQRITRQEDEPHRARAEWAQQLDSGRDGSAKLLGDRQRAGGRERRLLGFVEQADGRGIIAVVRGSHVIACCSRAVSDASGSSACVAEALRDPAQGGREDLLDQHSFVAGLGQGALATQQRDLDE